MIGRCLSAHGVIEVYWPAEIFIPKTNLNHEDGIDARLGAQDLFLTRSKGLKQPETGTREAIEVSLSLLF